MKALDLLKFINQEDIDNSNYVLFKHHTDEHETTSEFVERFLGGKLLGGSVKDECDYIAFYGDRNRPQVVADAVVTTEGEFLFIYEIK